jgi:hypothetical protein
MEVQNLKKSVISFLFIIVSGMLLMACMTAGSGGSAPVYLRTVEGRVVNIFNCLCALVFS